MKRRVAAVAAVAMVAVLGTSAPSAVAEGPAEGKAVFAVMNGARELKPDLTRHGGDPNGFGSFSAHVVNGNQFCYGITVSGIDQPVGAHIHRAPKTANGPVVIPLTAPSSGDPGTSSGCVTADPALLAEILARPPQFYVNVHTVAYPAGAIRGQLFKGG